jgi:hypothetical protein
VHLVTLGTSGYGGLHAFVELFWAGKMRARLWFHSGPTTLTNSSSGSGDDVTYYGRFTAAQFPDSIDLLRHEKPVYFNWNETTKGAFLSTSSEPIGEAETAP